MMMINSHKTTQIKERDWFGDHMAEVAAHERKQTSNDTSLLVSQEHYATLINGHVMC